MSTIFEECKKLKRQIKAYAFHAFAAAGCPESFTGPFRENIRAFLRECAEIESYNLQGMPTWCTLLVDEATGVAVPLYYVEENVKHSAYPFCDYCRCVGWSHHFVSKRRYHMVIPSDEEWDKPLTKKVFNLQTHLLHGLIHCNGFGHLLCINGHEGGSKYIRGRDIMDLWDRICTTLRTREVTVGDVSSKTSMELRLLWGVAYGQPWFGRWGYEFCHGSFGVTEQIYKQAIDILSSHPLDRIIQDFKDSRQAREIERIILSYRETSAGRPETVRDLLRCMLELKARIPFQKKDAFQAFTAAPAQKSQQARQPKAVAQLKGFQDFSKVAATLFSRWSVRRLELTAQVIVEVLKEKKSGGDEWMTRQDVRDAARLHIGDTGLIDFVLKSLNNCIVDGCVIVRANNPETKVLEFTARDATAGAEHVAPPPRAATPAGRTGVQRDVALVFKHVLKDYPAGKGGSGQAMRLAAHAVLHSKQFVKAWPFEDAEDEMLRFMCGLLLPTPSLSGLEESEEERRWPPPPPELVVVPPYATVGELRAAGEEALRDTYCVLERLEAEGGVEGIEGEEEELLFGVAQSGMQVWLRAERGIDTRSKLRYEGGVENWKVDCPCGAKDDDGERMVACDVCEVWQHTRCGGIDDADAVPALFLCARCATTVLAPLGHENQMLPLEMEMEMEMELEPELDLELEEAV
ncbi:hypothetical protein ACLOJK_006970 [Asimina triloba]